MKLNHWDKITIIKILLLAIQLASHVANTEQSFSMPNENEMSRLTERAIFALEKVLYYYKHNYNTINLDSLLGVRAAEGILRKILIDNVEKKSYTHGKIISLIRNMYISIKNTSEKSLPFVREDNAQAFEKLYKVISKPWQLFNQFKKLDKRKMKKKALKNIIFDGPTSDECISLLIRNSNAGYSSCNITDSCWQFETQKDVDGYTPTHQVLYFLFGQAENCENALNRKFRKTSYKNGLQDFLQEICGNILQTTDELWQDSNLLEIEKDLFMEQTLVCSLAGYEDFLNTQYFDMVLGWQTSVGCFGKQVPEKQGTGTLRKLQYTEKLFENGCLNHETGVAVALLAQYVRWSLEKTTRI